MVCLTVGESIELDSSIVGDIIIRESDLVFESGNGRECISLQLFRGGKDEDL